MLEKRRGNVVVGIMAFIGVCVAIAAIVFVVLQFLTTRKWSSLPRSLRLRTLRKRRRKSLKHKRPETVLPCCGGAIMPFAGDELCGDGLLPVPVILS